MGGTLDNDTLKLLGLGRTGMDAALATARQNTLKDKDYVDFNKLQIETNHLEDSFRKLEAILGLMAVPAVTSAVEHISTATRLASGQITPQQAAKEWSETDRPNKVASALDLLDHPLKAIAINPRNEDVDLPQPYTGPTWTVAQRTARLNQLFDKA